MTKRPVLIVPAVLLALVLLALAVLYLVDTHGIAAGLLGVACLVFAWFQTGGDRVPAERAPTAG
jgi:1,4-dihydroxy-2-naphthoate octaprenyltransferase